MSLERFLVAGALVVGVALFAVARARFRTRKTRAARLRDADVPGGLADTMTALIVKSRFCLACQETRDILRQGIPEVRVVIVDIADAPHLAETLRLVETPTTVLLDAAGRVRHLRAGNPDAEEIWLAMRRVWRDLETEGAIPRRIAAATRA